MPRRPFRRHARRAVAEGRPGNAMGNINLLKDYYAFQTRQCNLDFNAFVGL
jgi:hypothetical protein